MVSPFPAAECSTTAFSSTRPRCDRARGGHDRDRHRHQRVQRLAATCPTRSASGSCTTCAPRLPAPAAECRWPSSRAPHRRDPVPHRNDIGGLDSVVTTTATTIAQNATTVIAAIVRPVSAELEAGGDLLVFVPLFVWLTRRVGKVRRKITTEQAGLADLSASCPESLSVSRNPAR